MDKWRPLLVPTKYGVGYPDDFDRTREYEFRRGFDGEAFRARIADQSPYFNIAGLMWRVPNPAAPHSTP